tara:strand:- start:1505 stop:2068 length:564 start_codon:yes stop_codon:yes gene_type:complete
MAVDPKTNQPIYPGVPGVGLNHAGSYQASGAPYLTASLLIATNTKGSVARFDFPRVAKSVTVKVITADQVGGEGLLSDSVVVFFGEPRDPGGTMRIGKDVYSTNGTNAPLQFTQRHGYTLRLVSGSANGMISGEEKTFNVKTDHVNIAVNGIGGHATGSFQIYAELTNIPAGRMPNDYISGSGVNTL